MMIFSYFQRLGKALMLPISVLPVAALLLRLGQPDLLNFSILADAGGIIFTNLPLLFAMGIASGLSIDSAGAATIAGAVGYFVLQAVTRSINTDIDMSFFGGIISGIVAGHVYNKFHSVILPSYLGFFGGKRLVPILTCIIMIIIGWCFGYIWPELQKGINNFGETVADSGFIGQFIYGCLNRALIPIGLHHILNSYFWFGLGQFTSSIGELVTGDLHRFFAGDPRAGVYMTGFFPIMMFGLPAAALAMYVTARKEQRAKVGGVLSSVALTSFLTGITEPLEFMFMFLAPGLYAIHAVLTGLSLVITNAFGSLSGFSFSAGLFDMVLNWGKATNPWTIINIGLIFGVIYFFAFYLSIRWFNLKTIGREYDADKYSEVNLADTDSYYKARQFLNALGGAQNLTKIDSCITRLRLSLVDNQVIDEVTLKRLGASGVIHLNHNNLQVILGPEADVIAEKMRSIYSTDRLNAIRTTEANQHIEDQQTTLQLKTDTDIELFARNCLKILGGRQNVSDILACVTRIRITLINITDVDDNKIKALGASAVVHIGDKNLQIVVGSSAKTIAGVMKRILSINDSSNAEVPL